jgi:hypothetical protein
VSLNAISSNPDYVVVVLKGASDRLPSLHLEGSICDLAEAIGALHEGASVATAAATKNSTAAELNEKEPPLADAASVVLSMSRDLLSQVADAMIKRLAGLTTLNLRRLLQVFAVHRLQADALVEAIEAEVERRREHLLTVLHPETDRVTLDDALVHLTANAAFIKKSLIGGEEEQERGHIAAAPFKTIRKGLRYIFGRDKHENTAPSHSSCKEHQESDKSDSDYKSDVHDNQQPAVVNAPTSEDDDSLLVESEEDRHEQAYTRLREAIEQSLDALVEAAYAAQDLAVTGKNDHDDDGKIVQDLFELGRCDELIANYYRQWDLEFGTQAGFDNSYSGEGRRRDMAKRLLSSQLLP